MKILLGTFIGFCAHFMLNWLVWNLVRWESVCFGHFEKFSAWWCLKSVRTIIAWNVWQFLDFSSSWFQRKWNKTICWTTKPLKIRFSKHFSEMEVILRLSYRVRHQQYCKVCKVLLHGVYETFVHICKKRHKK